MVISKTVFGLLLVLFQANSLQAAEVVGETLHLGVIDAGPGLSGVGLREYRSLYYSLKSSLGAKGISLGKPMIKTGVDELTEAVLSGETDLIIGTVMKTLEIDRRTGLLVPAFILNGDGALHHHTVFFINSNSPIQALSDLRGHRLALEAPDSTIGFYVPLASLQEQGIIATRVLSAEAPEAQVQYLFAGSPLNQAYWVERGRADVGAISDADWQQLPSRLKRNLRIIYRSRSIPRILVSYHERLVPGLRKALSEALSADIDNMAGQGARASVVGGGRFKALSVRDRAALSHWRYVLAKLDDQR